MAAPAPLTWSLVIATYKRAAILAECLRRAAAQTRPPAEVVVVDASPDWAATRGTVAAEFAAQFPGVLLTYVQAVEASAAAQRNQAARLATGDVLFLIDDDSLMYPDCAEQVMRVYEADAGQAVAGVNAVHVPVPPGTAGAALGVCDPAASSKRYGRVGRAVRRMLDADNIFVPYDIDFPRHPIPSALSGLNLGTRNTLVGYGMTFRRWVWEREPFEPIMIRYSCDDTDMSYRASRHGALLTAFDAHLCHLTAGGGRLSRFVVTALGMTHLLVLHRLYGAEQARSRRRSRALMWRRFLIQSAGDLSRRDLRFPHARGILFAAAHFGAVFRRSPAELRAWYPEFQRRLIARHG